MVKPQYMCNDNGAVISKMLSEISRLNDEPDTVEPALTAASLYSITATLFVPADKKSIH